MIVTEIIRQNDDNTLSFGNHQVKEKQKHEGFEYNGDLYKVKTHELVTRLEKNGSLFVEAVPGAAFDCFMACDEKISFAAYAKGDVFITLELEPGVEYRVTVDGAAIGTMKSSATGKFVFSVTLNENGSAITIEKRKG